MTFTVERAEGPPPAPGEVERERVPGTRHAATVGPEGVRCVEAAHA